MALMMDNKPTEYKGEALVWEKLSSLLPNDVVVYNHREVVDDREFDFALLIKNVGIMVIEVKGWQSQYIFDVKGPDEIVIQGESQIYGSPEKQARGYRFDWLNFLNDQFAISPVVLSMVCYPFISEKEYKDVRLDIVSSRDFTIFSDDLNSATKLGQKISNAFVKKKPLNSTPFDEKAMAIVRQHFEPSYKAKDDQIVEVSDAYSLLKVFNKELTEKDSDELIEMYFAGTKIVAFVKSEIDLLSVCNKLEAGFNARGIISDKGNVRLAEIDERNDFSGVPEDGFGIFQKRFSCRCEADTAVRPLKERGTDAFFQRIHLLHHGRGGKGKLFRRFVETAVFGNGDECVQCFINHFAYTPS